MQSNLKKYYNKYYNLINTAETVVIIIFFICLGLNVLRIFSGFEFPGLDGSWIWGLNKLVVEPQLVNNTFPAFTYGPLGYLLNPLNYGNNWLLSGILKTLMVVILILLLVFYLRSNARYGKTKLFIFALVWFLLLPKVNYSWEIVLTLTGLLLWQNRDHLRWMLILTILMALIGGLALFLKFSLMSYSILYAAVLGFVLLVNNRRQFAVFAVGFIIVFFLFSVIGIFLFFNSFGAFIIWFRNGLTITMAFNYVFSVPAPVKCYFLALVMVVVYIAMIARAYKFDRNFFWTAFLVLPALFVTFKYGFVFAEKNHLMTYFMLMPLIAWLLFLFTSHKMQKYAALSLAVNIICLVIMIGPGYFKRYDLIIFNKRMVVNAINVVSFHENKKMAEEMKLYRLDEYRLPADWNEIIGTESIQIMPWELQYAEINNWRGWKPNGVLQMYLVCTPALDKYSADSINGADRPRFILLQYLLTLEQRTNLFISAPLTFASILHNYEPVKSNDNALLLARKNELNEEVVLKASGATEYYGFNEWITVPESLGLLFAAADFRVSLYGRFLTTAFKMSPSDILVEYADGHTNQFGITNANLINPFLVNYIPGDQVQLNDLFYMRNLDAMRVVRIKFVNHSTIFYHKDIAVTWHKLQ